MFILFVIFPAVLFNGIAAMRKARQGAVGGGEMRASELRAMILRAVEEATGPLSARITDLEERLGDEPVHALRERIGGDAIASAFDVDEAAETPADRRRARS